MQVLFKFMFLYIHHHKYPIVIPEHTQNLQVYNTSVPEFFPCISSP